jgi:hypothetical protein
VGRLIALLSFPFPPPPKSKKEKTPTSHTGLFSILANKKVATDY